MFFVLFLEQETLSRRIGCIVTSLLISESGYVLTEDARVYLRGEHCVFTILANVANPTSVNEIVEHVRIGKLFLNH